MPQIIDGYKIHYRSGGNYEAMIDCYSDKQKVGTIYFVKNDDIIPGNNIGDKINLFYSLSRFNDIVNILRYEKPLRIGVSTNTKLGTIFTGSIEEVGEEES